MSYIRFIAMAFAMLAILCRIATASDSYSQHLATSLQNHAVVLRHYYKDSKLKFDSDGRLISKATEGYGPADGRIYLHEVRLSPQHLVLTGNRLIDVYNPTQDKWEFAEAEKPTVIEVALPALSSPENVVPGLLNSIFLKQAETASLQCSPEEAKDFQDGMLERIRKQATGQNANKHSDPPQKPDAVRLDELPTYCLPSGERAYKVGRGIKAPHPKHTPDPSYSEGARNAKLQGTTVLMMIVSPAGGTSAVSVVRSLGSGLDPARRSLGEQLDWNAVEAVSKWRFDPAKFGDVPVPVMINVEVNFRLN
jgi:TonB family protein